MRDAVLPLVGTEAGRTPLEIGAGGDRTMELDRVAEAVVLAELEDVARRGELFSILSEEVGRRELGADYPLILIDPVDGSVNAKQGIPLFAMMLAILDGPTVDDTVAGCVVNLVNGETWTAIREGGAWHDGRPIHVLPRPDAGRMQLLGLEASPHTLQTASSLVERSSKIRILGSLALGITHTAAGGFDAFCAPTPMRVFDMVASLRVLAEAGGVASDMHGKPLGSLLCNLESRTSLVCAPDQQSHAAALKALGVSA